MSARKKIWKKTMNSHTPHSQYTESRNNYCHEYNQQSITYKKKKQRKQIRIDSKWNGIIDDTNNKQEVEKYKPKISQIFAHGQRCRDNHTMTEYLLYYGIYALHTNIYGDIIGLYEGGLQCWNKWFWYFLGGNMHFDLHNRFSTVDLFGSSTICGQDLCHRDKYVGYAYTEGICKKGWLEGLKYIVETLQINHIDNQFELLVDTAYLFNDDVLQYLMLENKFYTHFDVDVELNKYKETLWSCCRKHLEDITKPGSGWLHCLESLHYAPDLIKKIHGNFDEGQQEKKSNIDEGQQEKKSVLDNWMLKELEEVKLNPEPAKLAKQHIDSRINIIDRLIHSESTTFMLESCYYGLCAEAADAGGPTLYCVQFWNPRKRCYAQKFEYVAAGNMWGGLRLTMSDDYWLTAVPNRAVATFCAFMNDASQLWKIKRVQIENEPNIWIQVINKLGYKLIFSHKRETNCLPSPLPLLSISKKVNEIDALCIDIFSVAKDYAATKKSVYFEKHASFSVSTLRKMGSALNRHSFWRLSVDGSKSFPRKFDCYKEKVRNIANTLWQFKERYIQSLYDENVNDKQPPKTRRPSPPPQVQTHGLYECGEPEWNDKDPRASHNVYIPKDNPRCTETLSKYVDESFESAQALFYYLDYMIAMQIIDKQTVLIKFTSGKCICLIHTELHKNGQALYALTVENEYKCHNSKQKWKIMDYSQINDAFMTADELFGKYGIVETDLHIGSKAIHNYFADWKKGVIVTAKLINETNWKCIPVLRSQQNNDSDAVHVSIGRFKQFAFQSLKKYTTRNEELTPILYFTFSRNKYRYRLEKLLPVFLPKHKKYIAVSFCCTAKWRTEATAILLDLVEMKNKASLVETVSDDSWLNVITEDMTVHNLIIDSQPIKQIKQIKIAPAAGIKLNDISNNHMNEEEEREREGSDDILGWLTNIVKLPQYYHIFIEEGFEDFETILLVEDEDLIEMNIHTKEHRVKIMKAVQQIESSQDY